MRLSVGDRLEISELVGRYMLALDARDGEALAAMFTLEGVLEVQGELVRGRRALVDFVDRGTATYTGGKRHWTNNIVVDGDGDSATMSCYLMVIDTVDGSRISVSGRYDDDLAKVDGRWLFAHRRIHFDHFDPHLRT